MMKEIGVSQEDIDKFTTNFEKLRKLYCTTDDDNKIKAVQECSPHFMGEGVFAKCRQETVKDKKPSEVRKIECEQGKEDKELDLAFGQCITRETGKPLHSSGLTVKEIKERGITPKLILFVTGGLQFCYEKALQIKN